MDVQLGYILSCEARWSRKPQDQSIVEDGPAAAGGAGIRG
jgi:hypothetical protein